MSAQQAILALENGTLLKGELVGSPGTATGEVVFNTAMTGYQEMLTDPSYSGEILTFTFPLEGTYGINPDAHQSGRIQVEGMMVNHLYDGSAHPEATDTLENWFSSAGLTGIANVDTRAVAMTLRESGAMNGVISSELSENQALKEAEQLPDLGEHYLVGNVTPGETTELDPLGEERFRVACYHYGMKNAIVEELRKRGLRLLVCPADTDPEEVLAWEPDGIFLSNGPGDPETVTEYSDPTIQTLCAEHELPTMGICLGHQLVALNFGLETYKLKFGHRGANHPVKDLSEDRVHISSQNHGYAVRAPYPGKDPEQRPPKLPTAPYPAPGNEDLIITHLNVNDGSVEGLEHKHLPLFCVQYHPEGSPGPRDNTYLFDEFVELLERVAEPRPVGA